MDGFQLCEYIKSTPQLQFIKVLLLSARSQATDLEKGIKVRADDYMVKPFSPLLLLRKVNELME
jgi:CheY-like chemotaxis protein